MKQEEEFYVLFKNHESGLKLHKDLRAQGVKCSIRPTPREITTCCSVALLVENEYVEQTKKFIEDTQPLIEKIVSIPKRKPSLSDRVRNKSIKRN